MAKTIIMKDGDCLINISKLEGFFWDTVWNHPENQKLRQKRKHLNILKKGDKVYIPNIELKEDPAETEKLHHYVLKGCPARFTIILLDMGKPIANEKYILRVDRGTTMEGQTDSKGKFSEPIPPDARKGLLLLGENRREITINFGYVDPIDEVSGVQTRLQNLGFYDGEIDDILGPVTTGAIAEFQRSVNLSGEGKFNDQTRQALVKAHGD